MKRVAALAPLVLACTPASSPTNARDATPSGFASEVRALEKSAPVLVLTAPNGGRVAVSPTYQARVMTSAWSEDGPSLGWINHAFIDAKKTGTPFDNYGGEDRFWLGPEGGQFGLYFAPGKPFVFSEWQTPHEMQEGAWAIVSQSPTAVTFARVMHVTNASGAAMTVGVERTIRIVDAAAEMPWLAKTRWVAFESENTITNAGTNAWTKESGLPSIWILGMFAPAPDARIVLPFRGDDAGEIVNDRYFGKVPPERLKVNEGSRCVVLTADGQHRSKIGLAPARTTGEAMAYSANERVLTIVRASPPPDPSKPYVNSLWETQKEPLRGDAVNAYNDGPTEPGAPSLGGFYELETSSPAAELAPGQSMKHTQRTIHVELTGDVKALVPNARCLE